MTVEDLCSKATSRIIVDRLYPEDDDTAFNELRGTSSNDFFAEIEEPGKAQTKFQVDTNKITEELKELTKSINTATLNEVSTNSQTQPQQNNQNNNQRGNNKGNYRGNYRGNNPRFQNSRGRKNSLFHPKSTTVPEQLASTKLLTKSQLSTIRTHSLQHLQ